MWTMDATTVNRGIHVDGLGRHLDSTEQLPRTLSLIRCQHASTSMGWPLEHASINDHSPKTVVRSFSKAVRGGTAHHS
jgi:hypothetical protein